MKIGHLLNLQIKFVFTHCLAIYMFYSLLTILFCIKFALLKHSPFYSTPIRPNSIKLLDLFGEKL